MLLIWWPDKPLKTVLAHFYKQRVRKHGLRPCFDTLLKRYPRCEVWINRAKSCRSLLDTEKSSH